MNKSIIIEDTRLEIYSRDSYTCQYPGCTVIGYSNLELAHRIAQTKDNKKMVARYALDKFGVLLSRKDIGIIIHHPLNLKTSCRTHNIYFNIGGRPVERDELLSKIFEEAGYVVI